MNGRRLGFLLAGLALTGLGCGDDDGDGPSGTVGERYVEARRAYTDVACECFSELDYGSMGDCIDDLGFQSSAVAACYEGAIDGVTGTGAVYGCLTDAYDVAARCVQRDACSGAAACETAREAAEAACPALSAAVQASFNEALVECVGVPNEDTCPQINSNAGFGDTIEGSTVGLADDYSFAPGGGASMCEIAHGSGAPDVTIQWTAPVAGSYRFLINASATDFPAIFRDVQSCTDESINVCAEAPNGIRINDVTEGATALFVIDGLSANDAGSFVIDVSEAPPM